MKITQEHVRMLAEIERKMDKGEVPYVMLRGHRVAVTSSIMKKYALEQGQTINDMIFTEILKTQIEDLQSEKSQIRH